MALWAIVQAAVIAVSAYVGYLPFFQQYVPQVGGIALITTPSPWDAWLAMWGLFVLPTMLVVVLIAWQHRIMRVLWLSVLLSPWQVMQLRSCCPISAIRVSG
jgi:uncharacterized membrane protein